MSSKAAAYPEELQKLGIAQRTPAHISDFETAPCPSDMFNANCTSYPGKNRFDLSTDIKRELQNLYMVGKGRGKNWQISAEKVYYILVDTVIK